LESNQSEKRLGALVDRFTQIDSESNEVEQETESEST